MTYGIYILIIITLVLATFILTGLSMWAFVDDSRWKDGACIAFFIFAMLLFLAVGVIKGVGPSDLILYANSLDVSRSTYENIVNECKNSDKIRLAECKAKITEAELDTIYNYNRFINELNKTKN